METPLFRILLGVLLLGFMAHRGYYTRKVQHTAGSVLEQPEPGVATKIANLLAIPAFLAVLVYLLIPRWVAWASLPLPNWGRWLGVGVALGGFALLQWAQITLGVNWSDDPKLVSGQQLVDTGPYRWVRHPIYTAFLLILGSSLLISANWLVGGLWIAMTALDISARVETEENMLLKQFGEPYRDYMHHTGRLLPRLIAR